MSYRIPPSMDDFDSCLPIEVRRWYVAYAKVRCEQRAANGLREAGLRAYVPTTIEWANHARKRYKVEKPLFPRYFFVELSVDSPEFYKVRANRDIECLVGVCGTPRPIPPQFILDLQAAEEAGEFDLTHGEDPNDPYKPGDTIRVKVGTKFGGWPGKVLQMTEAGRVTVLLQGMMGKETERTFGVDDLEAAA